MPSKSKNNEVNNSNESIKLSLQNMFAITHIPFSLVNRSGSTSFTIPNTPNHIIAREFALAYIYEYEKIFSDSKCPRILLRKLSIMIGIIKLNPSLFLIVGPVSSREISLEEVGNAYPASEIKDEIKKMYKIYQESDRIDSLKFANILSALSLNLNHKNITAAEIINANNIPKPAPSSKNEMSIIPETEDSEKHKAEKEHDLKILFIKDRVFQFETKIFSAISQGNTSELDNIWNIPSENPLYLITSSTKNISFLLIPVLTVMSRAALYGGAIAEKVLDLYETQFNIIEKMEDINLAVGTVIEASYSYCELVRNVKYTPVFPEICRECEKYINNHISEKITSEILAQEFGISRKRLYAYFDTYFQMPVNEYINKTRLNKAAVMLESSDYTISEISSSLGFVSQSYFTKVFTKYYGTTPKKYKETKKHKALL